MVLPHQVQRLTAILVALVVFATVAGGQTASPLTSGVWSGNVTSSSATVCVRLTTPGVRVRLVVSTNAQLGAAVFSAFETTALVAGNAVALSIGGLEPDTAYYYGLEVAGTVRTEPISRGRFRTFPQGAGSFKLALVGDGDYRHLDQRAYAAVMAEEPLLILFAGDLHYSDLTSINPEDYRVPYDNTLKHPVQGPLFRSAPIAYMWDDHDFSGGDDSNSTSPGAAATRSAYIDYVPHYPLQVGDVTIGQAFTVGRVRIIMTDLRSAAVPQTMPENAAKTRMGLVQKAWFKQQLISARDANFPLILWLTSEPWIGAASPGSDSWAGYATERTELANFIKDNRIRNLALLGGDMHAIAYDNGTNSDYATGGGAPLVVMHAAPLSADPNTKGGPYTAGPFLGMLQYGLVEIFDSGGPSVQCRFTGKRVGEGIKLMFEFSASVAGIDASTVPAGEPAADRAIINIAARGRISTPTDALIAGFVTAGRAPRNFLLRAVGPSLAAFGVTDALPRPVITLYQGTTVIASNEAWGLGDVARLTTVFDRTGAFRLASSSSRDAAMYLTLDPGGYTLQASSGNGATGSVLLEVYEVP